MHSIDRSFQSIKLGTLLTAALLLAALMSQRALGQAPRAADSLRVSDSVAIVDSTPEVTHTVRKGDTLWDIARTYLKDPFRWPEVLRRNTGVVENPHWIYPGESRRIPATEVRPDVLARINTSAAPAYERTVFSTMPGTLSTRNTLNREVLGRGHT